MKKNKTFVDLFSGCGGFSLGACLAGYENILSVDVDPILASSYLLNFPSSNLRLVDLSTIQDITSLIENSKQRPNLVVGGPPCQGFSLIGKRNQFDPRNELIWHFFRHIKKLRPEIFLLENVEGLATGYGMDVINEAQTQLPGHYKISKPISVNASDFGAATLRPRVLIVGYDSRYIDDPQLQSKIKIRKPKVDVRAAIGDLPPPMMCEPDNKTFDWTAYKPKEELSPYAKSLRKKPSKHMGWPYAVHKMENGFLSGLTATVHTKDVKKRFRSTQQGETEPISRYFKLKWDLPSKTIRAGTGSDKGNFQAARPIHPTEPRVITVREAARIQGFPDWFVFHPTKWHSFRMIGNSVSPIMAKEIIKKL